MRIALFSVLPVLEQTLRVFDHGGGVRGDLRAVKRRLCQPPLAQPEIAFTGQQAFAKHVPVRPQHSAFYIFARVGDQHFFNGVRMIDKDGPKIDHANAREIAILTRKSGEVIQRIFVQRPERPASQSLGRAGREFAWGAPHKKMLGRAMPHVNEARTRHAQDSFERSARIRKAPLRESSETLENPAAVSLPGAVAGSTGTNVLLMCATRCIQPSGISNARKIAPGLSTR